jgi:hypothetical protein
MRKRVVPLNRHLFLRTFFNTPCFTLVFALLYLNSCGTHMAEPDPIVNTPLSRMILSTKTVMHLSQKALEKCNITFDLHSEVLDSKTHHADQVEKLEASLCACKKASKNIGAMIPAFRSNSIEVFSSIKKQRKISSEDTRKELDAIIKKYASLLASIRIGLIEGQSFITPVKVHTSYIQTHGVPSDSKTIMEEKEYVSERYAIYKDELIRTINEGELFLDTLYFLPIDEEVR